MNCEEYQALVRRNDIDEVQRKVAEVGDHAETCTSCNEWLESQGGNPQLENLLRRILLPRPSKPLPASVVRHFDPQLARHARYTEQLWKEEEEDRRQAEEQ